MPHWSKDPQKKAEVQAKISQNRKGKCIGNQQGFQKGKPSWNKGLPKEQQPKYGKPASQRQIENMRQVGSQSHPAWNQGISEWSPRIRIEELRKEALQRDQHKCTTCGSEKHLVIHHIKHWEEVKDWNLIHNIENLKTLCRSCHQTIHNAQKKQLR